MSRDVHLASLCFEYPTAEDARLVERSVGVEEGEIDDERSSVRLSRTDTTLRIEISAADLVALRAGLNSWLRYVAVAERVADAVANRDR